MYLNAGKIRWLTFTSADLDSVRENLRFETLARNVEAAALAGEWGVTGELTLTGLAAAAPEGVWRELLTDHGREMTLLLEDIESLIEANLGALRSALEGLARDSELAANSPEPVDELDLLAVQAAASNALTVVEKCSQPLVAEFLGMGE